MIGRFLVLGAALACAVPGPLRAGEIPRAQIESALARAFPALRPERIEETPIPGLYSVSAGADVLYVTADGRHLLRGAELFDIEERTNLTEAIRRESRLAVLAGLETADLIRFEPAEPARADHVVTVFTDIDCPYCVRLHSQMAGYNALGIEVRYAAYPRAGIPSPSYDKAVSVWCSDDPGHAIGEAKSGRAVQARQCDNPVAAHYAAGQRAGIAGTPAILLADGSVIPGYVPPERLLAIIERDR